MSVKMIPINKKAKFKSKDNLIKSLLKEGVDFSTFAGDVEVCDNMGSYIGSRDFNKEIEIKEAEVCFDRKGKVIEVIYYSSWGDIYEDNLKLFSRFPKLNKDRIPKPKPPKTLKSDIGVPGYDAVYSDDGHLEVGCRRLSPKQVKEVFKFLAECLDYDLEG